MSGRAEPVCLVIPPSAFLLDQRVFMSLGILRVAAALRERGFPVEVLDLSGIENHEEVARLHASRSQARRFGFTATTPQLPAAVKAAAAVREARPDARLILGGPHATLVSAAAKRERREAREGRAVRALAALRAAFDVVVAGDGEDAVFEALRPDAPALIDADDPSSPLFLTSERLTRLPFPARDLIDFSSYRYEIEGRPAASLIAQLGCPFECGFCGGRASPSLRRVRMRSAESIVSEMTELHRTYGVTGFMFYDDELNVNRGLMDLLDRIKGAQERLGVEWRLRGFVKSELFTAEQARALRDAGFRWLLVGFESGSEKILRNINKKASRGDNSRCLELAAAAGLKVKALMSIGHPGESPETVEDTRAWLVSSRPADFDVSLITTYPGTPYHDEAVPRPDMPGVWTYTYAKTGDRLHAWEVDYAAVAEYYKGDPEGGYRSFVFTDHLSAEQLVAARDRVEREVRARLGIPFNRAAAAARYEHSMGQPGALPARILRTTDGKL